MYTLTTFKKVLLLLNKRQKRNLFFLVILMLIAGILETTGISLFIPIIYVLIDENVFYTNEILQNVCRFLGISQHKQFLIIAFVILGLIYILKNIYLYFQTVMQNRFVYNNRERAFNFIYGIFLNKDYQYYVKTPSGNITRSIYYDVVYTFDIMLNFINIITEGVISFIILLFLFLVNWCISLLAGIVLLIELMIINKIIKPILHRQGQINLQNTSSFLGNIIQSIESIKEIKVFHTEDYFIERNKKNVAAVSSAEQFYKTLNTVPKLAIESITFGSLSIALAILVYLGADIKVFIPVLSAFAVAAVKLLPSLNKISANLTNISYYAANLDNVINIINSNDTNSSQVQPINKKSTVNLEFNHRIECKDIYFKYDGSEKNIFDGINIDISVNSSVGIIGESGQGKTTLVDLLTGLLTPNQGSVLCDGINIRENYSSWLSLIGYIPQNTILVNDTITSNVAFGVDPAEIDKDRVISALKDAQIYDFVSGMKDGLDTTIGDRGMKLSGGQRQRIGIARALYKNPKILIFDEATSALDSETEKEVMKSINSLMNKKTIIIISHRLSTLEKCDIIYKVSDGKIFQEKNIL